VNVLIVCTGNTCRSPMAGGLLTRIAKARGMPLSVRTAGLAAHDGECVAPQALEVMREVDIDISHEHAKSVTEADLAWADIVVGLDQRHLGYLADEYPTVASKLRWIGNDVKDPYLGSLAVYRATRDELERLFGEAVARLFSK